MAACILNLSARCSRVVSFMPWLLYPMERAPGIHWIEGWFGPAAGLNMVMKKILGLYPH
jgi:hypothetical protein